MERETPAYSSIVCKYQWRLWRWNILPRGFVIGLAAFSFAFGAAAWAAKPPRAAKNVDDSGKTDAAPTFYKDVLPIAQAHCQSCHRPGQIGPFSLLDYQSARPWAAAIKSAVSTKKMPPWFANPEFGHFDNDRSLKQTDIDTIVAWVNAGAPAGDPANAPPPVQWPEGGWNIQPDFTVDLPPYPVPATGVKEWEQLAIPSPFKEDIWVTSVEIRPGAPAVVHHLCFDFAKHKPTTPYNVYEWVEVPRDDAGVAQTRSGVTPPKEGIVVSRPVGSTVESRREGKPLVRGGNEFCYLPGLPYEDYRPMHAGIFVPAGSDILVSVHYTTNGTAVLDRSRIGITVSKTPPPRIFISQGGGEDGEVSGSAQTNNSILERHQANETLAIPPFDANYLGPAADITFKRDIELVWFRPHAHMRGKSVRYTLIYPDGREEVVLDVPHYDFNWQLTYRTSLKIPKGSRMHVQFAYDNSKNNKNNPDAGKWVYYGGQSWEEMGTPNMGFVADRRAHDQDLTAQPF
jgi:mono/diheme cytochrome c family protein